MTVLKRIQNKLLNTPITKRLSLLIGEKLEEITIKINNKNQHLKIDQLKNCSTSEDFFNFTSQEFGSH